MNFKRKVSVRLVSVRRATQPKALNLNVFLNLFDRIERGSPREIGYNADLSNKIFLLISRGEIAKLIIAHKDRLVRFGFDFFEIFAKCGKGFTALPKPLVAEIASEASQLSPTKTRLRNRCR